MVSDGHNVTLTVYPWGNEHLLAAQRTLVHAAGTRTATLLAATCAARAHHHLTATWDTTPPADQPHLATWAAASLLAARPAHQAPHGDPDPAAAHTILEATLTALGTPTGLTRQVLAAQTLTSTPLPAGHVWAPTLTPDMVVPDAGWENLDERLTGTPSTCASRAGVMAAATRIMSRGMGKGTKADPATVLARLDALTRTLTDPATTTVTDLARATTGQATTGQDLAAWLTQGVAGRTPALAQTLTSLNPDQGLDQATSPTRTPRADLAAKAAAMRQVWARRATEAATAAGPLAGTWLGDAIHAATNLPYAGTIYTDILLDAVTPVLAWREQVHAATTGHPGHAPILDTTPAPATFARGRWRGTIHADGRMTLTVPERGRLRTITVGWAQPAPITLEAPRQATTAIAPVLLTCAAGHTHPVNPDTLERLTFQITRTTDGWQATTTIPTPHSPTTTHPLSMGVHVSPGRPITWATWTTANTTPPRAHTTIHTPQGPVSAHPVHEGVIRDPAPRPRPATARQKAAARTVRNLMTGLNNPVPTPMTRPTRTDLATWALTTIAYALTLQDQLANLCHATRADTTGARATAARLHQVWPLPTLTVKDLPAVWGKRRNRINQALAAVAKDLLPATRTTTLTDLADYDTYLNLITQAATAPTPHQPTTRTPPADLAAAVRTRRHTARTAWAERMAAHTLDVARRENATTITVAASTTDGWVTRYLTAALTGNSSINIQAVTVPTPLTHPLTGQALPVRLVTVNVVQALTIRQRDTRWRQVLADATTNPATNPLILTAARMLDDLAADRAASPNPATWDRTAATTTIHLPHPAGWHLASADATYPPQSPGAAALGPLWDARHLRLPGVQDARQVTASHAAKAGLTSL